MHVISPKAEHSTHVMRQAQHESSSMCLAVNKAGEENLEVSLAARVLRNAPLVSEHGASALLVHFAGVDT